MPGYPSYVKYNHNKSDAKENYDINETISPMLGMPSRSAIKSSTSIISSTDTSLSSIAKYMPRTSSYISAE